MGKIICTHYGCGKTTYCKTHENSIDLDAGWFEKKEGWDKIYIECAKALTKVYDYVFITSHTSTILLLDKMEDLEWYLVYPDISLKEEYRERLENRREQDQKWINEKIDFYEKQIEKYDKLIKNAKKIILQSNEFISDIMDIIK